MGLEEAAVAYVRVTRKETALNMPPGSQNICRRRVLQCRSTYLIMATRGKTLETELIIAKTPLI